MRENRRTPKKARELGGRRQDRFAWAKHLWFTAERHLRATVNSSSGGRLAGWRDMVAAPKRSEGKRHHEWRTSSTLASGGH